MLIFFPGPVFTFACFENLGALLSLPSELLLTPSLVISLVVYIANV